MGAFCAITSDRRCLLWGKKEKKKVPFVQSQVIGVLASSAGRSSDPTHTHTYTHTHTHTHTYIHTYTHTHIHTHTHTHTHIHTETQTHIDKHRTSVRTNQGARYMYIYTYKIHLYTVTQRYTDLIIDTNTSSQVFSLLLIIPAHPTSLLLLSVHPT